MNANLAEGRGVRFNEGRPGAQQYRATYDRPELNAAVAQLQAGLNIFGISIREASLRWLRYHSALRAGDGIIIGGRNMQHAVDNVESINKGPLPEGVVALFEEAWTNVQAARRTQ